jgi:hypothetical protein
MGQCPFQQSTAMPSQNSAFDFDNAAIVDSDARVKVGSPSVEMRREVIIEV